MKAYNQIEKWGPNLWIRMEEVNDSEWSGVENMFLERLQQFECPVPSINPKPSLK